MEAKNKSNCKQQKNDDLLLFYTIKNEKIEYIQMLIFINNWQSFDNKSVNKEKTEYFLLNFYLINEIKLFAMHSVTYDSNK